MPTVVVTDEMTIKYERKIKDESFNQVGIANPQGTLAEQKVWGGYCCRVLWDDRTPSLYSKIVV